jgi:hypothetical protein
LEADIGGQDQMAVRFTSTIEHAMQVTHFFNLHAGKLIQFQSNGYM